jgi:putative tryptophan/tyrosine transport system substrate-binding protein
MAEVDERRRRFITLLSGAAAAWPLVARAQQQTMPVIGLLNSESATEYDYLVRAFREGLNKIGYVEGRNVAIEYRWAEGDYSRLPALVTDLVRRPVNLVAALGAPATLPAKAATTTIPIAFLTSDDVVEAGLVQSLNRPGGNMTGVSLINVELMPKRVEMLHELIPQTETFAVLVNPKNPNTADSAAKHASDAIRRIGRHSEILTASTESDIERVFEHLAGVNPVGLLIAPDAFFIRQSAKLAALSARIAVPAMHIVREFPAAGGLISYGANLADQWRLVGVIAGRILQGAKPAELPVMQPTSFELVINIKTAKVLGLTMPPTLLALVDEVIE